MIPYAGVDVGRLLQEGMRTAELNQRFIANNIANAETPNYNPARLDFQATLRAALEGRGRADLRTTQARHIAAERHRPNFERFTPGSRNDYNKVDLDVEMTELSQNTSNYTTWSALLNKRFQMVKSTLEGLR
ncbi:MAG: flagellar basal body rod protein FlgB [Candidatus Hydrogenedentota bacterium]